MTAEDVIRKPKIALSYFKQLRDDIPRLIEQLELTPAFDPAAWRNLLDQKILPRLDPDFPLIAAVCGGGSTGKSTLFNALMQRHLSPTGGTAGINRRILIAGCRDAPFSGDRFPRLFESIGFRPRELKDSDELITPGPPLYTLSPHLPAALVLLDTPDFDTGLKGGYANREVARQALTAADLFLYIFTNANYNNRDNTDFIADMLTGIGRRKCFLVYRCPVGYADAEVIAHARTVARNLYGTADGDDVLGLYRADEDNAVAAGKAFVNLRPVAVGGKSLTRALMQVDVAQMRGELLQSVAQDTAACARSAVNAAAYSRAWLQLYVHAVRLLESRAAHDALRHFPMESLLRRFIDIWYATDPAYVRWMRKSGAVVELPLKGIVRAAKWFTGAAGMRKDSALNRFSERFEADLLKAFNALWHQLLKPEVSAVLSRRDPVVPELEAQLSRLKHMDDSGVETPPPASMHTVDSSVTLTVSAHPALQREREGLEAKDWRRETTAVLSARRQLEHVSQPIDRELSRMAENVRRKMGLWAHLRQTFAAALNVLPATAAVTYVLSTGDPVGAVGIKVKLAGLFGLKDLYALVAIPATTGLKKADRAQLAELIRPIAKTWLDEKLSMLRDMLHQSVTGEMLAAAERRLHETQGLIRRTRTALADVDSPAALRQDDPPAPADTKGTA